MKYYIVAVAFISVYFQQHTECANILGVFPIAGKSVNILYQRLLKGLADAGHDITFISPYKFELTLVKGSVRNVLLPGFIEDMENLMTDEMDHMQHEPSSNLFQINIYMDMFLYINNKTYEHPNVKKLLNSNSKFDAVITEYLWNEALLGFAAFYKCPSIVFSSIGGANPYINSMVGNPLPPSYVPHLNLLGDYTRGLSFFDRFHNFLFYFYDVIFCHFYSFPANNQILKSAFPENIPDAAELYKNASLVLLGSHPSVGQATPLVPNIIQIGGFHIDPPKKLPKDLQEYLDGAKDGAIYFSMGTFIRSKDLPDERKKIFLNVFKKLKLRVIWKFEDEVLPGKPENVLIRKWVPQNDILGHPNIKLFISHGGYGSTLEKVYHGVPTLMIPAVFDQFSNAYRAQEQGYALKLSYSDKNFSEETLYALIKEMLGNPKYAENAKTRSRLFHDRPMKPLDTAVYWIEFVIRHRGADHLKVAAVKLPLYQLYMLDVISFLIVIVSVIFLSIRSCFRRIFSKSKTNKIKQN